MSLSRRAFTLSVAASPLLLHLAAHAQNATPAHASFDPAATRMESLLQYVPGGILDSGDLYLVWNDFERNVAVVRENYPDASEQVSDGDIAMRSHFANAPQFLMWAVQLEELTGYKMDQVMQTLEFGTPPYSSLLVALDVDPESLLPFWESMEYEERENDYGSFWTIGEEGDVDFSHPVQQALMARMNNIAILPDNTVAYATTSELLGQMMSTANGDSPNRIAELSSISTNLPEDSSNAWFMDGSLFLFQTAIGAAQVSEAALLKLEDLLTESNDAVGPMPVFRTACVGLTAGGHLDESLHNPDAREFIILETDGADQADQAAEVITWRTENWTSLIADLPYAELLPDFKIETLGGEHVLVSASLEQGRSAFSQMIMNRDTLLFAF